MLDSVSYKLYRFATWSNHQALAAIGSPVSAFFVAILTLFAPVTAPLVSLVGILWWFSGRGYSMTHVSRHAHAYTCVCLATTMLMVYTVCFGLLLAVLLCLPSSRIQASPVAVLLFVACWVFCTSTRFAVGRSIQSWGKWRMVGCENCGYDLTGISGCCPECGRTRIER